MADQGAAAEDLRNCEPLNIVHLNEADIEEDYVREVTEKIETFDYMVILNTDGVDVS